MKHLNYFPSLFRILLIISFVSFISCKDEDDSNICMVTVISGEGGYATTSHTEIMAGWEVKLTATSEESYRFVNWTVNGKEVSKENPLNVTISSHTQFKANFEKDNYKVTIISNEGGTAIASKEGDVLNGSEVTFSATAHEKYGFVNWTVNGKEVSKENPFTTKIIGDMEISANFLSHKINVESDEGGTANADKNQVGYNSKVTFSATPKDGYSFVNWTIDGVEVSKDNPYTTIVTEDIEIKANFISYKVTVTSSDGGEAKANKSQVASNERVTFNATPYENYGFVNWTIDGVEVSKKNPYTTIITEDIKIKANFIYLKNIVVETSEGGSATTSNNKVIPNEKVTFSAIPNEGYSFVNWTIDGVEVSKENPYTAIVTEDIEIKANFISYKVSVKSSEGGSAKADKNKVGYNEKVTFNATPNENYGFVNWTIDGVEVSRENPYITIVTEDIEIIANFSTHNVNVTSTEGGSAKADKNKVGYNEKVTFRATPNEGYSFVNWTINGIEVSQNKTYTTTVTEDIEIKANFDFAFGATGLNNNKGYVDLGLSVKWATCNVGANTPEGRGNYYAWGETETKAIYNWDYYKYYYSTKKELSVSKYCTNAQNGVVDNKENLELLDDAAHVNWGSTWRMPTREEWHELASNCKWERIKSSNGDLIGFKAISKINGNSIFFCVTGYRVQDGLFYSGDKLSEEKKGHYWIASLSGYKSIYGVCMEFTDLNDGSPWLTYEPRCNGMVVRAVCP